MKTKLWEDLKIFVVIEHVIRINLLDQLVPVPEKIDENTDTTEYNYKKENNEYNGPNWH